MKASETKNFSVFEKRLLTAARREGFVVKELGKIGTYPLYMLSLEEKTRGPNVLVAAGFHGDEPAGPLGVLWFLEHAPHQLVKKVNISLLPLVNPTGFVQRTWLNQWGEITNLGFCNTAELKESASHEGKILLAHFKQLKTLARNGFVSLHEDVDFETFYLYAFKRKGQAVEFEIALRSALLEYFEPYHGDSYEGKFLSDKIVLRDREGVLERVLPHKNAVIDHNLLHDGSFEDAFFHHGIPYVATTETPAKLKLQKRIEANAHIIEALAEFALTHNHFF